MGGRRRAAAKRSGLGAVSSLLLLVLGVVASVAAWVFLVRAAIDFGHTALGGQAPAWAFAGGATLGAIGCLLLTFVLLARVGRVLGIGSGYRPRRSRRAR
jgi:hypothetical protein